ncbi:F-box protein At1g70360-like [Pyrus communis]|uniref:F-box protein At1g70360-like n=1 Tax=Pyrus communis TaxID=23211 RepID=UPI0035C11F82
MLLEAGFVVFDPISGTQSSDRFHLLNKWPALDHRTMWVPYTLPHILHDIKRESINNSYVIQAVKGIALRFQSRGRGYFNVYGCLIGHRSATYRPQRHLCLHEERRGLYRSVENLLFGFWKIVKYEIVLPFLIELRRNPGFPIEFGQKPGSASPTGIMGLPSELKMKVLESLPGVDIVKLACVCKGMKKMVNDVIDELLWRDKYYEEIERGVESPAKRRRGQRGEVIVEWKLLFVRIWKSKAKWKQLEKQRQVAPSPFRCTQYRSAKRNQRSSA